MNTLHVNIRSLRFKICDLKNLISSLAECKISLDILLICETFMTKNLEHHCKIPNYDCIFYNRQGQLGSGIAIYVKKGIKFKLREDLRINEPGMVESGFIEIELDKTIYIVGEIYRVPNTSEKIFNEKYCELPKCIGNQNAIICGDFNIDYLKLLQHKRSEEFNNINVTAHYIPCITSPTQVTHNSCTLIDNIHVKDKSLSRYYAGVLVDDISDHFPYLLSLQLKMSPNKE